MLKFMVVLYRRPELTPAQFRHYLETVHASFATALPGLRRYKQDYAVKDAKRKPAWDAIIELYFESREAMEAAWDSPPGKACDTICPLSPI